MLVREVHAKRTQSGNTRYVLVDDSGREFTTFKEPIAKSALAAEGRRARITWHEQERNGFTNVYLDKVEALAADEEEAGAGDPVDEVAWNTTIEAAALAARHQHAEVTRPAGGAVRAAAAVQGARRRRHTRGRGVAGAARDA